jgi:hypothetical protein
MKTFVFMGRIVLPLFIAAMIFSFQGCKKTVETQPVEEEMATMGKRPRQPSPPPFSFTNCSNPGFSGNFVAASQANVTFTLNYVNSPGGPYPSFTSATVNGITITAPPGTLNTGAGSITFTATGTPVATGYFIIPVRIGASNTCNLQIVVLNNPLITVSTGDPGPVAGSTGTVSFNYQNQMVTYKTVRAADGKIWIQQNLGSPQVAFNSIDEASYGHLFQWGRWDDGHQLQNSSTIVGNSSLQIPSQITPGNPSFIKNQILSLTWWGVSGLSTDTWSGNTPTSTNGKNPCAVLGAGWRMPTASEWQNVINHEGISDTYTAFQSNLKLPAGGVRFFNNGTVHVNGDIGYFWTSTADGSKAKAVFIDNAYGLFISPTERGNGFPCRCLKD